LTALLIATWLASLTVLIVAALIPLLRPLVPLLRPLVRLLFGPTRILRVLVARILSWLLSLILILVPVLILFLISHDSPFGQIGRRFGVQSGFLPSQRLEGRFFREETGGSNHEEKRFSIMPCRRWSMRRHWFLP